MTLQCGIDEAGRGPLAGPVTAACAVLAVDGGISGLADSKKLSASRRDTLSLLLRRDLYAWGLGWAWPAEIDELNIHRASLLAMERAFQAALERWPGGLGTPGATQLPEDFPAPVYVDGKFLPTLPLPGEAVVDSAAAAPANQAASVHAKTTGIGWM